MMRLKNLWRKLGNTLWGLFNTCFVTCDFSTLTSIENPDVITIRSLFHSIAPFKDDEERLFNDAISNNNAALLQAWCDVCSVRRGYTYLPGILRIEGVSEKKLLPFLRSQRWVKSFVFTTGKMSETYDYLLQGLRQAIMLSYEFPGIDEKWRQVTITLGPVPKNPYDPNEPLNLATQRVVKEGITVIVAAGNEGDIISGNSLNPWAVPPWVIGVGATSEDGARLLEVSSRGVSNQSYEAPTVVAPGESSSYSGLNHGEMVALEDVQSAPPGTMIMAVIGSHVFNFIKEKDGSIQVSMMQDEQASSAVPIEMFYDYMKQEKSSEIKKIVGTSFAAEYVAARCAQIAKHVKTLLPDLPKTVRPKLIKTMLEEMAQPFGNHHPWEIGKGLVTKSIAESYLSSLTLARLQQLVGLARDRW